MEIRCHKMQFQSKIEARQYAKEAKASARFKSRKTKARGRAIVKMTPYLCEKCGLWHLTSGTDKKGKVLKAHNKKLGSVSD